MGGETDAWAARAAFARDSNIAWELVGAAEGGSREQGFFGSEAVFEGGEGSRETDLSAGEGDL